MKIKNFKKKFAVLFVFAVIIILISSVLLYSNYSNYNKQVNDNVSSDAELVDFNITIANFPDNLPSNLYIVAFAYINSTVNLPMDLLYNNNLSSIEAYASVNQYYSYGDTIHVFAVNSGSSSTVSGASIFVLIMNYTDIQKMSVDTSDNYYNYVLSNNLYIKSLSVTSIYEPDITGVSGTVVLTYTGNYKFSEQIGVYDIPSNYASSYCINGNYINSTLTKQLNGEYNLTINVVQFSTVGIQFNNTATTNTSATNTSYKAFEFYNIQNTTFTNFNSDKYSVPVIVNVKANLNIETIIFTIAFSIIMLLIFHYVNIYVAGATGFLMFLIGYKLNLTYYNDLTFVIMIFIMALVITMEIMHRRE